MGVEKKYVWITGQVINDKNSQWLFGGVYENKEDAIENCHNEDWFVANIELNKPSMLEKVQFELAWYPHLENEPI